MVAAVDAVTRMSVTGYPTVTPRSTASEIPSATAGMYSLGSAAAGALFSNTYPCTAGAGLEPELDRPEVDPGGRGGDPVVPAPASAGLVTVSR